MSHWRTAGAQRVGQPGGCRAQSHMPAQALRTPGWKGQVCTAHRAARPTAGGRPRTHHSPAGLGLTFALIQPVPSFVRRYPSPLAAQTLQGCLRRAVRPHRFKGRRGSVMAPALCVLWPILTTGPRPWKEEWVRAVTVCARFPPKRVTESTKQLL